MPFHGALGAIAGAYIARAHFGALGMHHSGRWRRPRLLVLAWLVPIVLHAGFDAPLFSLKHASADTGAGVAGILLMLLIVAVVGFGAIVFAALARRIAQRQKAWLSTKRLSPAHWRRLGRVPDRHRLEPWPDPGDRGSGGKLAGAILMAVAAGLSWRCGKILNEAAKSRHHAPAAATP